ncbi:hypothetical protein [Ciceribacter sp. RN22]|uniref:hypothetical protein n=1 Tax=Ciceribacter sp. RN22 TaxID=2954932 RepID=UPI0020935542|nr:hypothetical protein [Ciceribacter sp. RN22]MCO6179533.1 hypothetical protein [Ciceribacter sp. RN22]
MNFNSLKDYPLFRTRLLDDDLVGWPTKRGEPDNKRRHLRMSAFPVDLHQNVADNRPIYFSNSESEERQGTRSSTDAAGTREPAKLTLTHVPEGGMADGTEDGIPRKGRVSS